MNDELISKVLDEVLKNIGKPDDHKAPSGPAFAESTPASMSSAAESSCTLTEFVGTAAGHTIGLVIANVDPQIQEKFDIPVQYRAIGIVGSRTGAAPQVFAADEAVKASNSRIIRIELARDSEGGPGHGCLILFGAEDISDVRRAVEVCLEQVEITFGEVYKNSAGHIQFQYTARASFALNQVYGAPIGKSFGITVGAPAAIGVLMADAAVKSAPLEIVQVGTPANGHTSYANEVMLAFSGDSGAVKQAVHTAREIGSTLLGTMAPGESLRSEREPYII